MGEVTKEIAKYISEKQLSVEEIENDLGIPRTKLVKETEEDLSADEFMRLCLYLGVRPEQYYPVVKGIKSFN